MTLNIKHPAARELAGELARLRKVSITEAVIEALRHELATERARERPPGLAQDLLAIGERYMALREMDTRSDEEILGYDELGDVADTGS